jgi:lysophospholipase L1-like esterase
MSMVLTCDNPKLFLSPYTWKLTGNGEAARAEATMPGAYVKAIVSGTTSLGLVIDSTDNEGYPELQMPLIEYSIDYGPFQPVRLVKIGEVYTLPITQELDPNMPHRLEIYFRATVFDGTRWASSNSHLRIAGLAVDAGAHLLDIPRRVKNAIAFGDSITEGHGVEETNHARGAWVAFACAALDCEYGQLGTCGQGLVQPKMAMPPLPQTWDHYDASTSRLQDGLLVPEPDYFFCAMGTNDFVTNSNPPGNYIGLDITDTYVQWLAAIRQACPNSLIFCIVPPSGVHRDEIHQVVKRRNQSGDARVFIIDLPWLAATITVKDGVTTQLAPGDGVHPMLYGQAMFGACVAVEAQKIIDRLA